MSMQAKEVARILSKGMSDGKFNDVLAMEKCLTWLSSLLPVMTPS